MYKCVINIVFDSPVDELLPHFFSLNFAEFSCPQKPEQIMLIPFGVDSASIELGHEAFKVFKSLQLLLRAITGPSTL